MAIEKNKNLSGFTLIEVMVATTTLVIAVLGVAVFRYYAALSVRNAEMMTSASQTAQLLCEGWKGQEDPNEYEPEDLLSLVIGSTSEISYNTYTEVPEDFTTLGTYIIASDGYFYKATLSWKNISVGLRTINIVLQWDPHGSDPRSSSTYDQTAKSFKLTSYINY